MLEVAGKNSPKIDWSLFTQYSPEYGLELSDMGMDWAMEQQEEMPINSNPLEYYLQQIEGMSEQVKILMLEFWSVADELIVSNVSNLKEG